MSPANTHLSFLDMNAENGLVYLSEPEYAANAAELLALEEAKKHKADAVFFRRFENPSHSVPQVYIYEKDFSDDELVDIHTKLWSSGVVPLFYIVTSTEVKIFNCTKSVEIKGDSKFISKPIERFHFEKVADIQRQLEEKKFSAKLFSNGTFWEEHPQLINVKNSPYQRLLDGLISAKKSLSKDVSLKSSTISKLLVMGILIKYLEEKEDENSVSLLQINRDFYAKFPNSKEFTDILRNGQVVSFFEELNIKFNGKIFDLKSEEKAELSQTNLNYVAAIFDANVEGHQYVMWRLYAFNHLPIELISGLYEAFLTKEEKTSNKGVVYTPPYLVNMLIDECMPLYKAEELFANGNFKVFDPACGSGIFLVTALKRMVQWQAILNYKKSGLITYPTIEEVKSILKNNIFGVDLEEGATLISIFSLCIALCDKLSPMQILNDLRFDDLREDNIRTADFFKVFEQYKDKKFDLIIGNPPFNPPTGFSNKSYIRFVKTHYNLKPNAELNDDNIALFFWDKAVELRKKNGKICFILPSGAWLYNNNSIDYRSFFMKKYQVEKIIDFTHLSDKLFHGSTTVAVCATIATDKKEQKSKDLLHIVVKRTKVAEERFYFEIDHYDFHKVNFKTAVENPYVWKCNLWGGGRLLRLINFLSNQRSLGKFLEDKKQNDGWEFGEGYIIGHDGNLESTEIVSNGRKRKFYNNIDWITNKKTVKTSTFNESGKFDTEPELEEFFEWPRHETKKIFEPPHILIKENLGKNKIPIVFSENYLCFTNRIVGIHAPLSQREQLDKLYNTLSINQNINRFLILCLSAQAGIIMSNYLLMLKDIMNIPYPNEISDLQLTLSEKAIQDDVLRYYIESNKSSVTSPLNQNPTENDLKEYGQLFCDTLNPIYEQKDKNMKWFMRGFNTEGSLTTYVFCYGIPKSDILPDIFNNGVKGIESLIFNKTQRSVHINRVLREYLHIDGYDVIVLIKPKSLRYWLKSIALRDADETFSDLKINGF